MPNRESPASSATPLDPETWLDEDGDVLFRYAFSVLRDRDQAQDLVQEALLAALQSAQTFRGGSSRRTWLVGILRHKILGHLRRRRRAPETAPLDENDPAVDGLWDARGRWKRRPRSWVAEPEALLESLEFSQILEGCMDTLPPRQREALVLLTLQELESEEVCKVLEVAATNLWVLVHRARVRLRACLETRWFDPEGGSDA